MEILLSHLEGAALRSLVLALPAIALVAAGSVASAQYMNRGMSEPNMAKAQGGEKPMMQAHPMMDRLGLANRRCWGNLVWRLNDSWPMIYGSTTDVLYAKGQLTIEQAAATT